MDPDIMYAIGAVLLVVLLALLQKTGVISSGSPGTTPLPDTVPGPVARWQTEARRWAARYGLPWQVILAQIWQESAGNPNAVGSVGEVGLMQIREIAYRDLIENGYNVPGNWKTDPTSNIQVGAAYLHLMLEKTGKIFDAVGETKADALEAYNEGFTGARRDIEVDEYSYQVMQKARKLGF